jgi:glycosyltransferase involved in cell wall biosynthesis
MAHTSSPDRRLRVMHVIYDLGNGGAENLVIDICSRLPRDQFITSICVFEAGGVREARLDRERVELVHVRRHFGNDPTVPVRLAWQLRKRKVDVIHTHLWCTLIEGILAAKLAGVSATVHTEHGNVPNRRRQVLGQRWGWGRVGQVVAVSPALADRMTDIVGFRRDRIRVISNGVDTERFRPLDVPRQTLRREFGLPEGAFVVAMVARFEGFKDHAGVLRALSLLGHANEVYLALAGDGPLREEIGQLATQLNVADRVIFLGEIPAVERLLNAVDVLVSNSSHNEGMSLAILEGMGCGVPVVATRVTSAPELLDEGTAGILIPPRDPGALAEAIRRLMGDPDVRATLGRAGRERVLERYSMDFMVESYRQLYLRLARPRLGHQQVSETA